jgi:hypothetical protein
MNPTTSGGKSLTPHENWPSLDDSKVGGFALNRQGAVDVLPGCASIEAEPGRVRRVYARVHGHLCVGVLMRDVRVLWQTTLVGSPRSIGDLTRIVTVDPSE